MKSALAIIAALVLALCGFQAVRLWNGTALDTSGEVDFSHPLAIPPLAESHLDGEGRRVFDLTADEGQHDFGDGQIATWGFNGSYLGPTIRAKRGEQVLVNVHNKLKETTTVHWHGMHLPAKMDGGPHQRISPGSSWHPTWLIDQPAASLWYHPHPHGETAPHVYRGLAGMFLIDEASRSGLPDHYGVDDIPVIVQDKRFKRGGRLDESNSDLGDVGILGDTIAVNGTTAPYLDVKTSLVRLRILNASNARVYNFAFADSRNFDHIGTDGGLLPAPASRKEIMLSPAERAEIVVAMRPGETVVLRSNPQDLGIGAIGDRFVGGRDTLDILQLRAAATLSPSQALPQRLEDFTRLDPSQAGRSRSFTLQGKTINGRRMDMNRIDATIVRGSIEIWTVTNNDGSPHSFHVHDVLFQLLGSSNGWKDTVFLRPGQPVRLIARFSSFPDPSTPYMFHCHVLRHEDQGMMGQFTVV